MRNLRETDNRHMADMEPYYLGRIETLQRALVDAKRMIAVREGQIESLEEEVCQNNRERNWSAKTLTS